MSASYPHASTPRNKDRFLGTPVKRGANNRCAYGALKVANHLTPTARLKRGSQYLRWNLVSLRKVAVKRPAAKAAFIICGKFSSLKAATLSHMTG